METKPYLIALDLDGTLLKDDKTISPETARTIQKLKEASIMSASQPGARSVPVRCIMTSLG